LLEESIGKSRSLAYELSPPVLHHSDLVTALQWLVRRTQDQYGLHVQLHTDPPQHFESVPLRVFVFRAVQELLCNIAKHASVKSAEVVLSSREGMAIVTVSDKGGGFDPSTLDSLNNRSGFGLLSLRERANYMGGHLMVKSAPGRGSQFTFTLPLSGSKFTITDDPENDRPFMI
jgi:signal transduction histidine kinase